MLGLTIGCSEHLLLWTIIVGEMCINEKSREIVLRIKNVRFSHFIQSPIRLFTSEGHKVKCCYYQQTTIFASVYPNHFCGYIYLKLNHILLHIMLMTVPVCSFSFYLVLVRSTTFQIRSNYANLEHVLKSLNTFQIEKINICRFQVFAGFLLVHNCWRPLI